MWLTNSKSGEKFSRCHLPEAVIFDDIQRLLLHESGEIPHSASPGPDHLCLTPFRAGRSWAWVRGDTVPPLAC